MKIQDRVKAILKVIADLIWKGFGLFLFVLGSAAGVGAALTGSWVNGVIVAWGTLMLGVLATIGYAIATTGKATTDDVAKGMKDAIEKASEQNQK